MRRSTHFVETWRELPHAVKEAVNKGEGEVHEIFQWADQELSVLEGWMLDHIQSDNAEVLWKMWQHRYDITEPNAAEYAEPTTMTHEGEFCCLGCGANASFQSHATPRCATCHASVLGKEKDAYMHTHKLHAKHHQVHPHHHSQTRH